MECKRCHKRLGSKQSLMYHLQKRVCEREARSVFICEKCERTFSTKQRLQYHKEKRVCAKGEDPAAGECEFCDVIFEDATAAAKHKRHCVPCYCGDKKWHERRCTPHEHWPSFRRRNFRKKQIDGWFGLDPPFDDHESFDHLPYWNARCEDCGMKRDSDEHIRRCEVALHVERCRQTYGDMAAERLAARLPKAAPPLHPPPLP